MTGTTMAAPASSLHIGQVFNRAFALLSGDFAKFFLLMALAWSPYLLLALLGATATRVSAGSVAELGGLALVWGVLSILGQAAVLYGAVQKMRDHDFTIGESLSQGLARFFPIIGMILFMIVAGTFAFMLLVIPALILIVMWYVALPVCVVERLGPIESLKRSGYLTKGNRWRIFGIAVVIFIVNAVAQGVLQLVLVAIGSPTITAIGSFLWVSLLQSFNSIVVAVIYHDLRVLRDGADIERIAAVFD